MASKIAATEKSSHTPGWRVETSVYEHMAAEIVGERGIAQVWAGPNAMEFAYLIAAAPALSDALEGMLGLVDLICARPDIPTEAKDAIRRNHRIAAARCVLRNAALAKASRP